MFKITNITKSALRHQDKGKTIGLEPGCSAIVYYAPREAYNFKIEDLDKPITNHIELDEKKEEIKTKRRLNK